MGSIRVGLEFGDLDSTMFKTRFEMTYADMLTVRDALQSTGLGGVVKSLRSGLDAVIEAVGVGWDSGLIDELQPDFPVGIWVDVDDNAATIGWQGVVGGDSYLVRTGTGDITVNSTSYAVPGTQREFTNLVYGRTYNFRVSTLFGEFEGPMSPVQSFRVPFPVPAAPVLVFGQDSGIVLSWDSVPYGLYYDIYRDGEVLVEDLDGTTYTIADPEPGTHVFTVLAKNEDAESAFSNAVTVEV